jgi:pimeloyl-ACP methyl ester carboxylesterase
LGFPLDKPGDPREMLRIFRSELRVCADELKDRGIDLSGYNTNESADDLETLRKALGVEKISLWGLSYGSAIALTTIRRHEAGIHRAVLTGVMGPDQEMMRLPSTLQEQLVKLDRLFKADPEVNKLIPDLQGLVRTILDRLDKEPVTVGVKDSQTGQRIVVTVGKWDFQLYTAARISYSWGIRGLPSYLYPMSQGDYTPLAEAALNDRRGQVGSLMTWMVECSSGVSEERLERIRREAVQIPLGDAINFPFPGIGEALGNPDLGPEFRAPIRSDVRLLLISGTLDGRTPVSNAEETLKGFPQGSHLIVEGASHGSDLFWENADIRKAMIEYFKTGRTSASRIALPPIKFRLPHRP